VYAVDQGVKKSDFEMSKKREYEITRKIWGADEEFWVMMFSRHRRMVWSSAENKDAVFRCLSI